jgi:putative ABC transport system permease protein
MIGSKIVISGENNSQTLGMFRVREFTITGIVESPAYISIERGTTRIGNGRITGFVIIPKEDLNSGYYTEILATVDGAKDLQAYSDEYSTLVGETIKQLDNLAEERENIRYGEIIKDALDKMGMANIKPEVKKAELDKIKKPEWYIMDRDSNPGYTGFGADTERIDAITTVFPLFFFLVAALVCLTTMTRMVEEQRTQIGILKALGYSRPTIASKYLIYAGLACILGSIFGIVSGFLFFPSVIFNAYRIMYTLPPAILRFDPEFAAVSSFTAILCTAIATLAACYHELLSAPAELIRPRAPAPGRRVVLEKMPIIWNRLSFLLKVTARNLFRYKKRFFVTIFGVAGCTALLLTGFGLRDSIWVLFQSSSVIFIRMI